MLLWTWHVASGGFRPDFIFVALSRQPFRIDLSFAFTAFYKFLGAQIYSARGEELFAPHTSKMVLKQFNDGVSLSCKVLRCTKCC